MSATTTPAEVEAPLGLNQKLLLIRRGMKTLPKNGWNAHHKYRYVQSEDAVGKAARLLDKYGVLLTPEVDPGREPSVHGTVTNVPMIYTFTDVETGQEKAVHWLGSGQDKGDKGVYKAYTGATKFFLIQFFNVKVGDAPEPEASDANGASTAQAAPAPQAAPAQPETTVEKDADRPAAPRIPTDRAKVILEKAIEAGLATWDGETKPVFDVVLKAQLATLGVAQLGQLNVDQAEAVEAFIAAEKIGA